jgi:hypothetical protein
MTAFDVRWACDVLRPVYDATGGVDGRVSIEVDPRLAHDTPGDRRRGEVPVVAGGPAQPAGQDPGRPAGAAGHRGLPGRGDQHQRHADLLPVPLRRGDGRLPRRPGAGPAGRQGPVQGRFGGLVVRVPGGHRGRRAARQDRHGRGAIANARLAYHHYERTLTSPRWAVLQAAGARPQRPLWASTSVKDPAYPDTRYVTDLVAPGVVNTMPEATLRAVADHGRIPAARYAATTPMRGSRPVRAHAAVRRPRHRLGRLRRPRQLQDGTFVGFYLVAGVVKAAVGFDRGGDPEWEPDSEMAASARLVPATPTPTAACSPTSAPTSGR